ncbi:MAG TPA: type II secretion system F family protein [Microbacteriaceae bacterium]|nr:type II secretion system F family protein [Microbacteriaceae bacterium]HQX36439.1 type II secretion system F family protein [Microbacteriaceae bacterium]HQZ47644.1 type II secretion system F family protein [Microbacteriaceae bacterium]HRA09366.1 type II secretion system F family protein [Microbacteriaceae bacterium]
MTFILGVTLAAGLLLVLAPWLWRTGVVGASGADVGVGAVPSAATRLLADAGLPGVRPRALIATSALAALIAAAVVWLFIGVPALAVVAAVAAGAGPILWLRHRRATRIASRRGLWPDVLDHLVASVRAGMSLPDAVGSLGASAPAMLRPAFAAFERDFAASGHFSSSAERLKSALADPVADRIVETLRMAREVGGTELTTVLRSLSASVRAEAALRGEVEARQSWVRNAAVLGVVAPWVVLALLAARPEGARAYSSPEGVVLVVGGALISVVAYRLMLRIARLPEQRRWFA